jgi:hypothetical protein
MLIQLIPFFLYKFVNLIAGFMLKCCHYEYNDH